MGYINGIWKSKRADHFLSDRLFLYHFIEISICLRLLETDPLLGDDVIGRTIPEGAAMLSVYMFAI
jgi:hypothetical protein